METSAAEEEFITIVPVGENKPPIQDPSFVTVLTVGVSGGAAEVIVQRPRGARLGLGLKFEGGSAAAEKVRRLLVQSCAEDSPAANAIAPWGKLIPGDEILAIDGVSVSELTRIDCVRRLKDSDEKLTLLVRHFESNNNMDIKMLNEKEAPITTALVNEITRPTSLPPPVPPRKLGKKNSFKDKTTLATVGEQNTLTNVDQPTKNENVTNNSNTNVIKLSRKSSFDSHLFRQNKESLACLKKGSPEEVRRLVRRLSDGKAIPPEAEVYIDLLSNEWERCLALADAESDDTGSSISTVIDRLGSMANSVENSIPSTPIMQPKSIDIQKVLNSIENIDDNILRDMTTKKLKEQKTDINENCKTLDKSLTTNNLKNKTAISANLQVLEDINLTSNKKISSDKNNNNTVDEIIVPKTEIKDVTTKQEVIHEKPKPMPRNTKVERSASERKRRPIPIPEPPVTPIVDQLLTPTKKNCIETWLQRSETEMNNKTADKLEETPVPEVLPRLIDFVPKTQFVENSNETQTCTRPTAAPPPPPVDTREDGSGASLDTIGELDESSDVTDNAKRVDNDSPKRKTSYDKNYWNERLNRSDAEDKSLSNDETAVPTCPRQPPDGVETPSDAVEKIPSLPTKLPPRLPPSWPTTRPRFSYTSRTQDARSEASVKDKIAMFSSDLAISSDRLDKCGTLPVRSHSTIRKSVTPYVKNYTEISSLDRRLTKSQDNLDEPPRSFKRHTERPEVLGGGENTIIETKTMKYNQKDVLQKPLFYGSTTTLTSEAAFTRPVFHGRSISEDNSSKNTGSHKSNLEYLIEQRKKSMSKLRGLVIPEMQCNPIVDLPEIKVKDNLSKMFLQKSSKPEIKSENKVNNARPLTFNDSKWKTNFLPNNLPKYSPAFKRKSLQVYSPSLCLSKESTPERKFAEKVETINKINNIQNLHKPLKASSEITRTNYINSPLAYKQYDKNNFNHNVIHNFKNVEVKICTTTEVVDSDNDSAMSSTQSSYRSSASSPMHHLDHVESDSSRMSPKIPHYATYIKSDFLAKPINIDKNGDEYTKRKVCRSVSSETNVSLSSSAGSGATSGSQASCSSLESSVADSEKRRVSKTYNVDTINRRNILASAKCRSGRDAKLKSPVIETKFSHESHDRSPSPVSRPPERLSTLPSNVSVITNKGDSRRRNKVVVDSDSDSEGEVTVRQRKSDFKNSRLKRNSSTNNKTKPNGIHVDVDKNEEVPQVIKDKIMNEINKAGLDDYNRLDKKLSPEISKAYPGVKSNNNNNNMNLKNEVKEKRNVQVEKDLENRINIKPISTLNVTNTTQLAKSNTQQNEYKDISKIETHFIHLKKGNGSGVGLILAGGTDCEAKDVTVHRVLSDSIAAKAGIQKGTKIKSINGCLMTGLTHAQSVSILKEQRSEVVIEIENESKGISKECGSDSAESKGRLDHDKTNFKVAKEIRESVVTVLLEKAGGGAGLGFGLDGGRDSPNGDRPLTIKKLFAGGAAAQSGRVLVGAELLSAGGQSFEGFTRTQAWAALKALPAGQVSLVLKNPCDA